MLELEKLKHLLEHWIEHSREHTIRYAEWAEKVRSESPEVSEILKEAVKKFEEGEKLLKKAMDVLSTT